MVKHKILILSRIVIWLVMTHASYQKFGNITLQYFDIMQMNEVYLSVKDRRGDNSQVNLTNVSDKIKQKHIFKMNFHVILCHLCVCD